MWAEHTMLVATNAGILHSDDERVVLLNDDLKPTENQKSAPPYVDRAVYVAVPARLKSGHHDEKKKVGVLSTHLSMINEHNEAAPRKCTAQNDVEQCLVATDGTADSMVSPPSDTIKRSKKHRPLACYTIIILQIAVFIAMVSTHGFASLSSNPFMGPSADSINTYGAKNPEKIRQGEVWRALTALFQSVGILDLFFSTGMLICFGSCLEARWGSFKWLVVYLTSGICGNLYSSFLVEPMVVSVGDGGCILGLLGFVHIEMVSSIILSSSKRAPVSSMKTKKKRKHVTWSSHQQQLRQQKEHPQQDQDFDNFEDEQHFLHCAIIAIGMLLGIIFTFAVEWVLNHFQPHPYLKRAASSHQHYMKKDWSVLYGGLMTGILCGCIWNACKIKNVDRSVRDRVRLFYGLTLVTIPMLMVGVYSISN